MFRISKDAGGPVLDLESLAEIEHALRHAEPGRYRIDVIADDPLQFVQTSRRWGGFQTPMFPDRGRLNPRRPWVSESPIQRRPTSGK